MKIFFLFLVFTSSTYARTLSQCLDESIETALAHKVVAATQSENGTNCNNIDEQGFKELYEQRELKTRFKNKAIIQYRIKKKIELRFMADLDEEDPGVADEARACSYTNLKNNVAIRKLYADKYPALKDCPEAVNAFKKSMSGSGIQHADLSDFCGIVQKAESELKSALTSCVPATSINLPGSEETFRPAQFSNTGSGSNRAASGTQQ